MNKVYLLKDLDCAACSVKIEKALNTFDEIDSCTLDFINKKLYIETTYAWESEEQLIEFLEKTIHIFESEVYLAKLDDEEKQDKVKTPFFKRTWVKFALPAISVVLLVLALFVKNKTASLVLYIASYLFVGYDVIFKSFKKLAKGGVFDENVLMVVATIGALALKEFPEGIMVMLLYKIGEGFQDYALGKSRKTLEKMLTLKPQRATVLREGEEHQVRPEKIRVGDLILVKNGEKIAVDGKVVTGNSYVDNSMLTGESLPVKVSIGAKVYGGAINTGGPLIVKATSIYSDSSINKVVELVETASANKPKAEKFITKFARWYTPVVFGLALTIFLVPSLVTSDFSGWLYKALNFLVVSCPCAIVISVPLAFFSGVGRCAKYGMVIKGANYLDILHTIDTVIFDKTGTLTNGDFKVQKICPIGISQEMFVKYLCYVEKNSTHPIAKSVAKLYSGKIFQSKIDDFEEITGEGLKAKVEGKMVLCGNSQLLKSHKVEFEKVEEMGTVVYMAIDNVYVGYVVINDTIKEDAKKSVEALKSFGIKNIVMLTGDKGDVAKWVGDKLSFTEVYSDLMPEDKLEILNRFKTAGHKIMYVGDGINDAPVLSTCDIGVAMGDGSDIAVETGDMVLMTNNIMSIVNTFIIEKATRKTYIENIIFALGVKVLAMVLGVLGITGLWMAVFADVGVSILAILNSMRLIYFKPKCKNLTAKNTEK